MTDRKKCAHAEDLVTYFYGEANEAEQKSFEQHLNTCAACREELAAFGHVRGAVHEWRAEVFDRVPALALAPAALPEFARNGRATSTHAPVALPRRSAWAALREFFTLTPMWARAGMVAASLVVCALAALALVNAQFHWDDKGIAFHTGTGRQVSAPQSSNVPAQPAQQTVLATNASYTQADIDKLTAERDAALRELAATRTRLDGAQQQVGTLNASLTTTQSRYQTALARARAAGNNQGGRNRRLLPGGQQLADADEGLNLSALLDEVSAGRTQPQVKQNDR
ncbi:MAG: anti-sigma factor family protein [Pyrinomonadaceae bacterium]